MVKATTQVDSFRAVAVGKQQNASTSDKKYHSIKEIAKRFDLNKTDIRYLFGIPESTQFRYEKQNLVLKIAVVDRIERFNRIVKQALELFEDEGETKRWLSTPKTALSGETPLQALATDAGAKTVEEMLYRAEYGMFG
ncbi:type II RES/Xre toxin-antitoxin system antitoxin [Synechocystis sp. PCC 7509]|uniref:type II RES/Xre toxin-antitoxin system antitoxin n=1 Tax=Synechocystis sp. PCC 7509 TaxID=927677 RepID=UPI0002AC2186|nr:antitoxin Xre/MbcA/ParS toxin-binding domain-containing protein [Synechocystis sp. PCC 7509]